MYIHMSMIEIIYTLILSLLLLLLSLLSLRGARAGGAARRRAAARLEGVQDWRGRACLHLARGRQRVSGASHDPIGIITVIITIIIIIIIIISLS